MPGFDYKFLEKPKRRFQCPLCSKAMREPVQVSTCGHRFCDTCLQEFLRYGVCVCVCDPQALQAILPCTASSSFGRATVNKGRVGVSSSPFLNRVLHSSECSSRRLWRCTGPGKQRLGWTLSPPPPFLLSGAGVFLFCTYARI